jgi:predicted transcriptional regulator
MYYRELAAIDRGLDDARSGRFSTYEAAAKARAKFRGE